jgi:hypothetical protein
MGAQTRSTHQQLVEQRDQHQFVDASLLQQGRAQQTVTNVMFGVAGLAVVSGIALFVWDEFAEEKEPAPSPRPSDELVER